MLLRPRPEEPAAPAAGSAGGSAWRCTCSAGRRRWRSRRARSCSPAARSMPRDADERGRLGRPGRGGVGPRPRRPARAGPGPGLRRRQGDVRGVAACCSPGPPRTRPWPPPGRRMGGRPAALLDARCRWPACWPAGAWSCAADLLRPWARWITPVTETRRYRHQVLRGRAARRPADQGCQRRGRRRSAWIEPGSGARGGPPREISLHAADRGHPGRAGGLRPPAAPRSPRRRRITRADPRVYMADGAVWLTVPARDGLPAVTARRDDQRQADRRHGHAAGAVRARPQPVADDAGRHQHLADRRAGLARRPSWWTPGRTTRGTCAGSATAAAAAGQRVSQILLTHGHPDHAEGAAAFAGHDRRAGARPPTPRTGSAARGWRRETC